MDPNIKQSIIDRLKQTNNVLVTVKNSPTVDQLAACIGLTVFLNKLDKHATAVFSGDVPSTIEFLKPEETLEKDTNSLRDFIISLDKSKADKLRYKVEDKVVKIFITPYRTSLSQSDLDFSQGDFNVDVVIAIGVHSREELDQAIVAHGRILHDATVISINNGKAADLGALNWNDDKASSLCEMTASLVEGLRPNSLDAQMATAFLTGIVSETDRFSNPKTSSQTMSLSAKLMAAGANQQLVATRLQEPLKATEAATPEKEAGSNGTLEIEHRDTNRETTELPKPVDGDDDSDSADQVHIDEDGNLKTGLQDEVEKKEKQPSGRLTLEPPTLGGTLTGSTLSDQLEPSMDPLSTTESDKPKILTHDTKPAERRVINPIESSTPSEKPKEDPVELNGTLSAIEEDVKSPHLASTTPLSAFEDMIKGEDKGTVELPEPPRPTSDLGAQGIDDARKAVEAAALSGITAPPEPVQALNAQPLGVDLRPEDTAGQPVETAVPPITQPSSFDLPPSLVPPDPGLPPEQTGTNGQSPTAPPPVPPPMMPPTAG